MTDEFDKYKWILEREDEEFRWALEAEVSSLLFLSEFNCKYRIRMEWILSSTLQ